MQFKEREIALFLLKNVDKNIVITIEKKKVLVYSIHMQNKYLGGNLC